MNQDSKLKDYYFLTKPGIVYGNALTAVAGFLFAANGNVALGALVALTIGISLVIASACVVNNYTDRNIDRMMSRTKKRALVTGSISTRNSLFFASMLGITGFAILLIATNIQAVIAAVIGFIFYTVLYGISKRKSIYGTEIGSISGSMPIVAGYVAASGSFDTAALILFLIMTFWQMPHFFAIAILRSKDYAAALLPVLPVKHSVATTKPRILIYICAFWIASLALTLSGNAGYVFAISMTIVSAYWLNLGLRNYHSNDTRKWSGQMFGFSLTALLIFSLLISIETLLP